jgi:hypothetical protein
MTEHRRKYFKEYFRRRRAAMTPEAYAEHLAKERIRNKAKYHSRTDEQKARDKARQQEYYYTVVKFKQFIA